MKKLQILVVGLIFWCGAYSAQAQQTIRDSVETLAPADTTKTIKQAEMYLQFSPAVAFSYTGSLQQYTVPTTGAYQIVVNSAQGGAAAFRGGVGGSGARVSGTVQLLAGTVLDLVVGGQGVTSGPGGGGGGSFVYVDSNTLLFAAGGGGGGYVANGGSGVTSTSGSSAQTGGAGGTNGSGGGGGGGGGGSGGGAGWLSSGSNGTGVNFGNGGSSYPTFAGGTGSFSAGGYGGGAGGGSAGGGGGGYSGGGGADGGIANGNSSGGGSFIASSYLGVPITDTTAIAGTNSGNGSITITFLQPTAASVSISGRVLTSANRGLMNAVIYLTDPTGNARSARTNAFGYYRFADVSAGQNVVITVVSKRYQFTPRVLTVSEEVADVDFVPVTPLREK